MDVGKLFGLDKLDGILGRIERRPLRLYEGQCLRERDRTVECESCASHCPVDAIDLDSKVEVDFEACIDCGICVRLCPAGVFESRLSEDTFLGKIQQKLDDSDAIGFSCAKQLEEYGREGSFPQVELPCLGRLTETMLVGAAAFGAKNIWLDLRGCEECDCAVGALLAKDLVVAIDRLLEAWDHQVEFSLAAAPPELAQGATEAESAPAGETEEYDRRELLTKFGREMLAGGLGLAEGRIDRVANVFDPPSDEYFTYRLPRRRELFLRLTKKIGGPEKKVILADGLPFYGLELDHHLCNFCGNCATFCPTKALELESKELTAELKFTLSRCLGCDLCLEVCRPDALKSAPRIDLGDIFAERTGSLSEQQYYKCEKCKQPFASATERELCDFCRLREEKLQDDSWS